MDMALEYSVMDDIFDTMSNDLMDDEYYPANESEFGDYQSTRRNFGSKVIGLIRSIFERIIAAIRKLAAWVYNFFKHIKEGVAAVRAANAASELKIELDRIFNIAYNQAKNIVNEVKSYGILGVKQGEKIAKKAEKQAAKNNGTVNVDSVAPKVNELVTKVDGANGRFDKLQEYIRTASASAAKKTGATSPRDVVADVAAKIKLKCEADIKSYLDTAAKQYEELNKKLNENAVDVEGAKALATLNAKVNEVLRKIVNMGAGASGEGGKVNLNRAEKNAVAKSLAGKKDLTDEDRLNAARTTDPMDGIFDRDRVGSGGYHLPGPDIMRIVGNPDNRAELSTRTKELMSELDGKSYGQVREIILKTAAKNGVKLNKADCDDIAHKVFQAGRVANESAIDISYLFA